MILRLEGNRLRRLFSTFAQGWPGAGLLLLRLASGAAIISHGLTKLRADIAIPDILGIGAGLLLVAGLWTPLSGSLVAILGLWNAVSGPEDPWANILLGVIGASLTMLGPGRWSVDAQLFGWKRIDLRDRRG